MSDRARVWTPANLKKLKELVQKHPNWKPTDIAKDDFFRRAGITASQIRSRHTKDDILEIRNAALGTNHGDGDDEETMDIEDLVPSHPPRGGISQDAGKGNFVTNFNVPLLSPQLGGPSSSLPQNPKTMLLTDSKDEKEIELIKKTSTPFRTTWTFENENSYHVIFKKYENEVLNIYLDRAEFKLYVIFISTPPDVSHYTEWLIGKKIAPLDRTSVALMQPQRSSCFLQIPKSCGKDFDLYEPQAPKGTQVSVNSNPYTLVGIHIPLDNARFSILKK